MQKRRVLARAPLMGGRQPLQLVSWQTANPPGGHLPYAKAHLAIETTEQPFRALWQTDGGETQYLVDAVSVVDLDKDGVPEIISLWWEGASAGAMVRVFHWDAGRASFIELAAEEDMGGVHRYEIGRASRAKAARQLILYSRSMNSAGQRLVATKTLAVQGSLLRSAATGKGERRMTSRQQQESGIEGEAVIGPTRPVQIVGDPTPDVAPFQTTLVICAADDGREVARVQSGADGKFRVTLPPGNYLVKGATDGALRAPRAREERVTVAAGKFARVRMMFDSGMR